jgi:hypothetical protein
VKKRVKGKKKLKMMLRMQRWKTDAAHDLDNAPDKSETSLPVVFREPEWQLSKKDLKKKELAVLDAVLAELGPVQKEENGKQHCLLS